MKPRFLFLLTLLTAHAFSMKVLEKYFTNWANGSATGISTVKTGNDITSGITYNMQGLQVDSNYRGIVIKNGRKYMQK